MATQKPFAVTFRKINVAPTDRHQGKMHIGGTDWRGKEVSYFIDFHVRNGEPRLTAAAKISFGGGSMPYTLDPRQMPADVIAAAAVLATA